MGVAGGWPGPLMGSEKMDSENRSARSAPAPSGAVSSVRACVLAVVRLCEDEGLGWMRAMARTRMDEGDGVSSVSSVRPCVDG